AETTPRFTVKIPIEFPQVKRTVGIIKPKNRELAPSANDFYEFVIQFFSKLEQYQ
ncbi:LysR family transcriptional regulator, partial [Bacillus vallismortis]|nr:LysR family transcriptional regulator [Bacillus vallismortis]